MRRSPPPEQAITTIISIERSFCLPPAVGNLAYDLSDQDVIDYFSQAGPVKTVR
jgi:hypothetical protein